jgi:cytochrome c
MKNTIYLLLLTFFTISCDKKETSKTDEANSVATLEKGEALFTENNCIACHKIDQKIIGPSLQETAKIYKAKNGNMIAFLKEEAEPIVNQELYETMKINLQITKTMTDEELQSLEMYILSHSK